MGFLQILTPKFLP